MLTEKANAICSAQSYELLSKIAEHLDSFYFMDLSY